MDMLERSQLLLGKDNILKLQNKTVAVFGLGGVGGIACEALVRSGIGNMVVFDGDVVAKSNQNRQIIATTATVGQDKTKAMSDRLLSINPKLNLTAVKQFFMPDNADGVDFTKFDYVVDAVDTVTAKLEIIERAKKVNVKVISCMGTGGKLDITKLTVGDVFDTKNCPLAKIMRRELRARNISELKTVYSTEEGVKGSRMNGEKVLPSMMFVPAAAGLMIAKEVVTDLIK